MRALLLIAKQNMKKRKGDTIVFFVLIALATVLLYTSISVFAGLDVVLDKAYEKAHTADLSFMSGVAEDEIRKIMTEQEEVEEYEGSECLYLSKVEYRKEGETEKKQASFFFGNMEEERSISKLTDIKEMDIQYDSILLPYYMKAAEGFSVGDICYFTIGEEEYRFEVTGFVEDPLFATPLNVSTYGGYISSTCMDNLVKENPVVQTAQYVQHKVRLHEGEDSFLFDNKLSTILTQEVPELAETSNLGVNWTSMKGGVSMMSQISMGILLVFSLLLMLVVLIIIRFSIRNYIEMNMKNMGILQAAGYTSKQLNFSVILEMGMISGVAVIIGILLGAGGSDIIGSFEGIMLGLSWNQTFHGGAALVTTLVILSVVFVVAYMSGRIYQKISVLDALRGGIHTHNFRKNYFAFERFALPIPIVLAGKNLMNEKAKNISVFGIVMILAFSSCVGFGLYENFSVRSDMLLKMLGAETGDILITGENLDAVGIQMEEWEEVETILYSTNCSVKLESGTEETTVTCDIWKDPFLVQNEMIISGRLPKFENEIVLTNNVANLLHVDTGDTIYVTGQGERKEYIVCGIDQKISNMGLRAMLSMDGAVRLNGSSQTLWIYVYTKDGVTYEEISQKITEHFLDVSVTDSENAIAGIMNGVVVAMVAICLIFVIITVFVVAMVEILLVKSKIIRERRNLGINKALGFTTIQLVLQTMLMNLPVIIAGSICGTVLSTFLMEPLVVACLSFCGIKKCPFSIDLFWMLVTVIGIILVAFLTSFVSAVRIRKIEPVKMLVEE